MMSTSSPTSMKSSHISTDINAISSSPGGSGQINFNSLVSVDRSKQQKSHNLLVEDQQTLQLALELSIVGLSDTASVLEPINSNNNRNRFNAQRPNYQQMPFSRTQQEQMSEFDLNKKVLNTSIPTISNHVNCEGSNYGFTSSDKSSRSSGLTINHLSVPNPILITAVEDRSKKSQNMTECVPVPSSEHVAEIVGRQGCKIKALRAKTNTYIKTPVRGEEPVFVVTGRKEDVAKAKREVLSAAEHFSLIRATRKPVFDANMSGTLHGNNCGVNGFGKIPSMPPSDPKQVTIQVRVPYRVVGLVVGPKGATIKHIQHQTQTYILTPSREKEPIFEVTGLPDNVQSARKQIEAHIALRTGNLPHIGGSTNSSVILSGTPNETLTAHSLDVLSQILNDSDILVSLCETDDMRAGNGYGVHSCKLSKKVMDIQDSELPGNVQNFNFSTQCRQNNSVGTRPQFSNYISDLINKEASIPAPEMLTDLEQQYHNTRLQQQLNLCPSAKYILNDQMLPSSSLSPLQGNQMVFLGNVGSYMQTISFSNNLTAVYNAQSTACTSITSAVGSSNVKNINPNTHNSIGYIGVARSCSSASSTASSKSANNSGCGSRPELINIWKGLGDSLDMDEGIGDSPNIWNLPASLTALTGSHCSPSTSISPTDSLLGEISAHTHQNSVSYNYLNEPHHETNNCKHFLQHHNFKYENSEIQLRGCLVCQKKEITAALVPCGHNMFCMECANRICELNDSICPVCNLSVYHAMRILA